MMTHTGKLRCMTALYLTQGEQLLCLQRNGGRVAAGKWVGAAGGHFESGELNDARACVLRELREELGLTEDDLTGLSLRYITLRLKNGEVRQNYYFFAALKDPHRPLASTEGQLRWFLPQQLQALPMPGSAKHMLEHWVTTGRHNDALYGGISTAGGAQFTRLEEYED